MSDNLPVKDFFDILSHIRKARNKAFSAVNKELITLYWELGKYISGKINSSEWGNKTVDQLAAYIKEQEPGLKGFERRNLYRMKQFYETYENREIVSPLVTQLSWTNNQVILSRCKTIEEKEFYIKLSLNEKYSKRELDRQITSGAFERTVLADSRLSRNLEQLPQDTTGLFKDSYVFEFLNIPETYSEENLKKALLKNLKKFILELGRDFTLLGEEFRLQVGKSDFYIDLLFYHRELQCLVAIELKIDSFKPDYIGRLEFYLESLDRDIKKAHENPSIGILLCRDKDDEVVEYALSRSLSPTVVADYETKLISKELLSRKLNEFYELLEEKDDS
ncbi:MAG: DUF1016 domain-containing protein [bacterium]|nr:DUF1016 domain-containing protein [bacterium]